MSWKRRVFTCGEEIEERYVHYREAIELISIAITIHALIIFLLFLKESPYACLFILMLILAILLWWKR